MIQSDFTVFVTRPSHDSTWKNFRWLWLVAATMLQRPEPPKARVEWTTPT